jgi:CRISPR-associated protein Csd1
MLRALVESAPRFELPPDGYEVGEIRWIVEIDPRSDRAEIVPRGKGELRKMLPTLGDRAGKVSEDNLKPALLVDNAGYALGMTEDRRLDPHSLKHRGFRRLIRGLKAVWPDSEPAYVLAFLYRLHRSPSDEMGALRDRITRDVKPKDVVAFRADPSSFPFESGAAHSFWRRTLVTEYCQSNAQCCSCGAFGPVCRILPFQVSFAGYSCPISSFNAPAFNSFDRDQTANSPLCFECASKATRALQHLLGSDRNHRVLVSDKSMGEGKSPLRNQWAVFWLKDQPAPTEAGEAIDVEEILARPLGSVSASNGPPADSDQVRRLYGLPFSASDRALNLGQNRFFVAVLSPNKSRLVLREWIDESVVHVVENLRVYDEARTIQAADGCGVWQPNIPAMLEALTPWRSRSASSDTNMVRSLLRTAYQRGCPPVKLLEASVLRFRVPDRPKDKGEEEALTRRRQTLAASIKFVLTYGTKEAIQLQSLNKSCQNGPYLCGRLLAILEEAQLRASRWRVQATLVDRYYGGASSSPGGTFSVLVNQSTRAHMPKIRKVGAGYQEIEQSLEEVLAAIDDQGGFPKALTLYEQGEFALGFYHQRACFRAARPQIRQVASAPNAQ